MFFFRLSGHWTNFCSHSIYHQRASLVTPFALHNIERKPRISPVQVGPTSGVPDPKLASADIHGQQLRISLAINFSSLPPSHFALFAVERSTYPPEQRCFAAWWHHSSKCLRHFPRKCPSPQRASTTEANLSLRQWCGRASCHRDCLRSITAPTWYGVSLTNALFSVCFW